MSAHSSLEAIFFATLEKGSAAERAAYLDEACAGDNDLRQRIERMLTAQAEAGSFLEVPVGEIGGTIDQPLAEQPGTEIGHYKLLQQIGEGGMGVVYMAEQREPVSRRVALKIIKPGMDSRQVIARFEAERQALAMMDHPNVSKVFDAGTTDTGRPYFVMELVKGLPITQYCDQHKLNVRERLELFVLVCQAIQHAHQKGIIHRDIKPSNVMVARYDDRAVPKIIDFGVAKAIEHRLTEKTVFTQFGQIVGTFEYMSPEQAQLNQLDIDTRSDVYSLGVLLYELLTGETPLDGERLRSAAFDELLRIIREEDPLRPSARLSTSDTAPENAANRQIEPKHLSSLVQGELDWIVMKALEKDRSRRYETATALGADVEHYLNDEPVEACPPSSIYMIGKFTRRNKGWLSTAAAVLLTVLAGLTVSTILIAKERDAAEESARLAEESARREAISAEEADRQRQRAEDNLRESRAAVDRLFTRAAEELAEVPHMTDVRRALLEDAAEFYEKFVEQKSDDPEIQAEMGRAYRRLGYVYKLQRRYKKAVAATRQSVKMFESLHADYRENVDYQAQLTDAYLRLVVQLNLSGKRQKGLTTAKTALKRAQQLVRQQPDDAFIRQKHARLYAEVANLMKSVPNSEQERENLYRTGLVEFTKFREDFPEQPIESWQEGGAHNYLGMFMIETGRGEEAEQHLRRAIDIRQQLVDEQPRSPTRRRNLGRTSYVLASYLFTTKALAEAEVTSRSAADIFGHLASEFPGMPGHRIQYERAHHIRCNILRALGRFDEFIDEEVRFLASYDEDGIAPTTHQAIGRAWRQFNLGLISYHRSQIELAAESFRNAFASFEQALSESDAESSAHRKAKNSLRWTLATCPLPQFRDAGRSIAFSKEFLQQEPESADHWNGLGIGHYRAGDWDEAVEALNKSVEISEGGTAADCYFLAMAHWWRGEEDEAHQWYQRGLGKDEADGAGFDADLLNFRRETEKLLGIDDKQPEGTGPGTEETTTSTEATNKPSTPERQE